MTSSSRAKPDKNRQLLCLLTSKHEHAIELLLAGSNDTEAAKAAGVTRQTVNEWRHHHPAFIAELNRRRAQLAESQRARLFSLRAKALDVIERELDRGSVSVAMGIMRLLTPVQFAKLNTPGPTEPEAVIDERAGDPLERLLQTSQMPSEFDRQRVEQDLAERLRKRGAIP